MGKNERTVQIQIFFGAKQIRSIFQFNLEPVFPEILVFLPKRNSKVGFPCGQKIFLNKTQVRHGTWLKP